MALLELKDLTKHFGGLAAVNGLNFDVNEGEILSLIGPNGAGKSTVFNLITSYLRPTRGTVIFPSSIVHSGVTMSCSQYRELGEISPGMVKLGSDARATL